MIGFISLLLPVLSIVAVAFSVIGAKIASLLLGVSITLTVLFAVIGIFAIRRKTQWMSLVFSGALWILVTLLNKFVAWETSGLKGWLNDLLKTTRSSGIPDSVLTNSIGQLSFVLPLLFLLLMIGLFVLVLRISGTSVLGAVREWWYAIRESMGDIHFGRPETLIRSFKTLKSGRLTELTSAVKTLRFTNTIEEPKRQIAPLQTDPKPIEPIQPKTPNKSAVVVEFKKPEKPVWPSVTIAKRKSGGGKVTIPGKDRFLDMIVLGTIGSGKTARLFEPMVHQDMDFIAQGGKACVIIVEPNRTFAEKMAKRAKTMNIPYVFVNEAEKNPTVFLNPFEGEINDVSETITTVLKSLFGEQDGYFQSVQEAASRGITQMLKLLLGDDLTMREFASVLRSEDNLLLKMKELTQALQMAQKGQRLPWWSEDDVEVADNVLESLEGKTGCSFRFITENNKGEKIPKMNEKKLEQFFKVANGLQQQIDKIIGNSTIRKILTNKSTFKIGEWLEKPGMIIVNTGNQAAGNTLGRFFLLLLQDALLKRPGNEDTRTGVFAYIDEYADYAASTFKQAITQGRKYRAAFVLALQNIVQLELRDDKHYATIIKGNCRNKVVLPGLDYDDAIAAERMFGEEEVEDKSIAHNEGLLGRTSFDTKVTVRKKEQSIISASHIMYMPKNLCVYKIVVNDQQQIPDIGITNFADQKIRYKFPDMVGRMEPVSVLKVALDEQERVENLQEPMDESADTPVYNRLATPETVQTFAAAKGSVNDRLLEDVVNTLQRIEADERGQSGQRGEKRDDPVFNTLSGEFRQEQSGQMTFFTGDDGDVGVSESVEEKNKSRRRRK